MINTGTSISDLFSALIPEEYRKNVQSMSDAEFAQRQCDWYNESYGNLDCVDCSECKNRGYFQSLDSEGNRVMRECKCMTERKYIKSMINAGLGDLYEKCTFDSYNAITDWQKTCKVLATRFAYASNDDKWILFSGASGCGKTHLCTAICSELARNGRGILYVQWNRLFAKLVQTKFKLIEQEQILSDVVNADVLYIDDFLKMPRNERPKDEMIAYALEIIDARCKSNKKTILSTEFFLSDIIGFDEALGSRIEEKTKNSKIQVKKESGRNYRLLAERGAEHETD